MKSVVVSKSFHQRIALCLLQERCEKQFSYYGDLPLMFQVKVGKIVQINQ